MALHRLLISLAVMSPSLLYSQISNSIEGHFSSMPSLTDKAWQNSSLLGYEYSQNLSSVSASFYNSSQERFGDFKVETYMQLKNITIDAQAHYDNGAKHNVRFCENADIAEVYPYLTYDAVGGNQNLERYSFGGEISIKINQKWNLGAEASYNAGLFYRNVDPRPKNITGTFKIGASGSYVLDQNYALGIAARYVKYKQSCDILFKSELGESKIYHLTGLGTHYDRFAAQGKTSYYTGNTYCGNLTLLPLSNGFYLFAGINRDIITRILEDLNKLPLSKTVNTVYGFQAGYKSDNWGITASADITRRHGYENIFGDAATGQYPKIGSLAMFLSNSNIYSVKSIVKIPIRKTSLYLNPTVGYQHYNEIYRQPRKQLSLDNLTASMECKAITAVKDKVMIHGGLSYQYIAPLAKTFQNITVDSPDLKPYLDVMIKGYNDATSQTHNFKISLGSSLLICKGRYAVGLDLSYCKNKLDGDYSTFSASFKF